MSGDEPIRETTTRLDRLWEATRPTTPAPGDWDRVWATVAAELDRPAPRRGWVAIGLIVVSQAAAILLALGLTLGRFNADPEPTTPLAPVSATAAVRVEEGQLVLIRADADVVQVTELSPGEGSGGVDAWYLVFNLLESLANPVVAMSE